jgi:tetratricopeptide (TPR) repeat protein
MTIFEKIIFSSLILLLVACSNSTISTPSPIGLTRSHDTKIPLFHTSTFNVTPSPPNNVTLKSSSTKTSTKVPTYVRPPTKTASITPSITPTFDVDKVKTHTPAPPALCPQENTPIDLDVSEIQENLFAYLEVPLLEYLNSGGTYQGLVDAFRSQAPVKKDWVEKFDLTGDGQSEIIVKTSSLFIFGCQEGDYKTLLRVSNPGDFYPRITIEDLNLNGILDIVVEVKHGNGITEAYIYEWDGEQLQSLILRYEFDIFSNTVEEIDWAELAYATINLIDIDKNGTVELTISGDIPPTYLQYGPYREETQIYMWNGTNFNFHRLYFSSPEFRFQAVQDGDRASLAGRYDEALEFYQQAISDETLDWWSEERQQQMYITLLGVPTPTLPAPDQNEYYHLAAYSHFRIMLLHILNDSFSDAEIIYKSIQDQFPEGDPAHLHAEMAQVFWDEYLASNNIGQSCSKVIKFVKFHPVELLFFLGNIRGRNGLYHGTQSLWYSPEDICPFR